MDGAVLSILLTGLLPDVRYTVVVAAVTSLGVGAESPPVSLLLSESFELLLLLHGGGDAQSVPTLAQVKVAQKTLHCHLFITDKCEKKGKECETV